MRTNKTITIFLSSPSDVAPERDAAERAVARIAGIYHKHLKLRLERWEAHFYEATLSFQEAVAKMDAFDLVVGILWKRMGTELSPDKFRRSDGSAFESGTAYEIESAIASSRANNGCPSVYVFRKMEPVLYTAAGVDEEKAQKEALDRWWGHRFRDGKGHFVAGSNSFNTVDDFEEQFERFLLSWARDKGYIPAGPVWDSDALERSPYPGLVAYDIDRTDVFFGRAYATQELEDQLVDYTANKNRSPVVFVIGASGSGKSSLARAGLVPVLTRPGTIAGVDIWRTVVTEPSSQSIQTLADHLYASVPTMASSAQATAAKWAGLARSNADAAADTIVWALRGLEETARGLTGTLQRPTARLLILVDQLESIFGSSEQAAFGRVVSALVETGSTWLLFTMRSDRYAELQLDPQLIRLKGGAISYDLPPPGSTEINDIIKGPARAAGLEFATQDGISLAEVLRRATPNADALPLLQMTLSLLFAHRSANTLTFEAYETIGGLDGAIASHANSVFADAPIGSQRELAGLLQGLVQDVSRQSDGALRFALKRVERSKVADKPARIDLLSRLIDGRLLVSDGDTLRVAHEALLRRWDPASRILAGIADARVRKAQVRVVLASSAAFLFLVIAVAALVLYDRSNANLRLALRTKADQFVEEDMPTRAYLLAHAAKYSPFSETWSWITGVEDEETVRLRSIEEVTRNASSSPKTLLTDRASVTAIATSQDGRWVLAGYASGDVRLRLPNGEVTVLPISENPIISVKLNQVGTVAFVSTYTEIFRWDIGTNVLNLLCTTKSEFTDMDLDITDNLLIWTTKDKTTTIVNLDSGQIRHFQDHAGWVLSVAFSGDGKRFASVGDDGIAIVRDADTGTEIASFNVGYKDVWSTALSHDGAQLATAAISGPVSIWSVAGSAPAMQLPLRPDRRWKVKFSLDGKVLGVASWAGTLTLFDGTQFRHIGTIDGHEQRVNDFAFDRSSGDVLTASNSGRVRAWPLSEIRPIFLDTSTGSLEVIAATYNIDGTRLIAGGNDGIARVYSVRSDGSLEFKCAWNAHSWVQGVAFVANTSLAIALTASNEIAQPPLQAFDSDVCEIYRLGNLPTGGGVSAVAASQSTDVIAWAAAGGAIALYDVTSQTIVQTIKLPSSGNINDLSFNRSGTQIVAGTETGGTYLVNLKPRFLTKLVGPTQNISSVRFSPDSTLVAAGGNDESIYVWRVDRPADAPITLNIPGGTNNLAFDESSKHLAAGSDALYISVWRTEDWKPVFLLHTGVGIRSVYGYNPVRGDLAFDGMQGVVRILPRPVAPTNDRPFGSVNGIEPSFDLGGDPPKSTRQLTLQPVVANACVSDNFFHP